VDAAAQYRQLLQLGRKAFLASAAPAALVRYRAATDDLEVSATTRSMDQELQETLPYRRVSDDDVELEVFPLVKKPGAAFPDRITIGRTTNNDIVINEASISRLHAYVRPGNAGWLLADAGSKNGSTLRGAALEPRKEQPLPSRAQLKLGDVELTFYLAADLYAALGGPT
jgi:hypothetical protein